MIITKSHELLAVAASLIKTDTPLIVEAGAFWGHDSLRMALQWPKGTVHSFEPVPELYQELCKRTGYIANIIGHRQALSTVDGFVELHVAYKKDRITQASSVHQPHKRLGLSAITFPEKITVPAITLSSFMQNIGIQTIDLLWLDLQGHELAVLAASADVLTKIKMIHMEVYFVQAYKDHLLYHDVQLWLDEHNFVIVAQDFKNTKDHFFGNVLCVQKTFI